MKARKSVHQSQGYCGCAKCKPQADPKKPRTFDIYSAVGFIRVNGG